MSIFQGFPPEAFTFFAGLEEDNSKTYWEAHKAIWEEKVSAPMQDFLTELEADFPPFRLFRPNRDVRFSKDKSPYKLWIGATSEAVDQGGTGYYIRLGASSLWLACGIHTMAKDQLEHFRAAIDSDLYGSQFEEIVHTLSQASLSVTPGREEPLKSAPQGYAKDHPRINFLRWKGVIMVKEFNRAEDWLQTPQAVEYVRDAWHAAEPLKDWLDKHVGQSQEPREKASSRSRKPLSARR
ncbi:TIGR02453 family protein [Dictyobacter sp. S3.2.2.5]|uniref:TIGR02453 family protein n=1 Tax=Dictyobacter halimunensis TaxID=3026934 RepID=A0ABQ6FJW8_9CHLR|nr:TIGR02453 family protein [Dictyobacter sp. S3.2.2.5]